jgi:hypothetical protein
MFLIRFIQFFLKNNVSKLYIRIHENAQFHITKMHHLYDCHNLYANPHV